MTHKNHACPPVEVSTVDWAQVGAGRTRSTRHSPKQDRAHAVRQLSDDVIREILEDEPNGTMVRFKTLAGYDFLSMIEPDFQPPGQGIVEVWVNQGQVADLIVATNRLDDFPDYHDRILALADLDRVDRFLSSRNESVMLEHEPGLIDTASPGDTPKGP